MQNADDAASQKGVCIKVKTNGDYLIVSHNGYSFDKDDFDAITSAANGTKKQMKIKQDIRELALNLFLQTLVRSL